MVRNNSNTNINSKDTSNIDNNEGNTKISNDKTIDESDTSKIINSNGVTKIDSNPSFVPHNTKTNSKINNYNSTIGNLKDIYDNIIFFLPPNCYKVLFNYEINNNYNTKKNLYQNLKQVYVVKNIIILKEWANTNEIIFKNIFNSSNGSCEYTQIKTYIYYFLFLYYVERNIKESMKIHNKMLSFFKNNFSYQLTLNDLAIINLLQGLMNNIYIENEEYFSKCVLLLLINYGDPRGRHNDSHGAMQFPLWEISRKTYKLEEPIINENFKEMYQSLDFFDKKKGIFNLNINQYGNAYNNFNYMYNIVKNFEKIKLMNIKIRKKNTGNNKNNILEMNDSESIYSMINNIDENPNENYINRDITDKNISLSNSIFDNDILQQTCIKHNIFPSISCKSPNVGKVFYRKEFIIYIIKEIQSLLMGRGIVVNKKYVDKKISEDIITIKEKKNNNNIVNQNKGKDNQNDIFNETPLKEKYTSNFTKEKQMGSSFPKTNPYYEIEKKYNINRNTQYLPRNKHVFNTSNISKSYNSSVSTSNGVVKKCDNKINSNSNSNNKINNRKAISNNNYNFKTNNISNKKPKNLFSHFLYVELLQKLSYKKNLPSGIIISFGNNTHNETSHDRYEKLTLPRVIFKLKNEMIKNIYSGWQHNIVLNNDGEIFTFGHNQEYQCGLPNNDNNYNSSSNENINDPTNISIIYNNLKATKVSCGNEHSLVLSDDNNVYAFGNNENGLLGIPDKSSKLYVPTKINFDIFNGKDIIEEYNGKIINISCGTLHSLALTEDGKIFSWGSYHGGQLGFSSDFLTSQNNVKNSEQDYFLNTPTLIPFFTNNEIKIQKISCGEAHSLALSEKGKVYSWGFGSNGQLGLGFCEDSFEPGQGLINSRIFEPELIKTFKDYNISNNLNKKNKNYINCHNVKIKDIQCGKTFSMFINNTNNLFACGINDLNQLGFKDIEPKENLFNPEIQCDDYIYPSLLKCFENKKVEKISCGEGHCLAIVNDINSNTQSVWSWGNNKFGQLGHGSIVKISLPKEVEYLTEYNANKFSEVSCGGFHSLCLLKSKNNLDWIEIDYNENIVETIEEIGTL
jgi:alpha-tubulin suppressor-like RCC1 family protein